jgi:3-oxoacyl-[acyl-carrier protein] reductase
MSPMSVEAATAVELPFVAVVTGSSSGIGQAVALELARRSASLILHGRSNLTGLHQTSQLVRQTYSKLQFANAPQVSAMLCDIRDEHSNRSFVDAAFQKFGYVDAWIHAAGADVLTGDAKRMSFTEKLDQLWAIDVRGTILLSRFVVAKMLKQKDAPKRKPSMIHIGWDQAEHGMEGDSGQYFAATKAAIAAFSKSLAKSVAPAIRINCIAPGWVQTEWGQSTQEVWQMRATGESMLNRWGTPADIARVVAAVSMEDGQFINAQTITVNGGWKPMAFSATAESHFND